MPSLTPRGPGPQPDGSKGQRPQVYNCSPESPQVMTCQGKCCKCQGGGKPARETSQGPATTPGCTQNLASSQGSQLGPCSLPPLRCKLVHVCVHAHRTHRHTQLRQLAITSRCCSSDNDQRSCGQSDSDPFVAVLVQTGEVSCEGAEMASEVPIARRPASGPGPQPLASDHQWLSPSQEMSLLLSCKSV